MREDLARRLLELAAQVADGAPVDWDAVLAAHPEFAAQVDDLRLVASVGHLLQSEPPPLPPRAGLAPGTRLGRFCVEGPPLAGGMGHVYPARDEVLERPVALKLLPEALRRSSARLARLEEEARVLASLNHPNIATIHGLEEDASGRRYLVLEWFPGGSLAARLAGGALSLHAALEIGAEIAHGLAAAHEAGVVHRDLKPANVMFTAAGRAKLIDFGLARRDPVGGTGATPGTSPPSTAAARPSDAPPEPTRGEAPEPLVGGTWGYASPERIYGEGDRRADSFAFGCVLYECLTGLPAFSGRTIEEIHEAVAHRAPEWSRLPEALPPAVRRMLVACLEKEPGRRLASMSEAGRTLEQALGRGPLDRSGAPELPRPRTSLVGRAALLSQTLPHIAEGRLVTLTGTGGAGKTRLALALAAARQEGFPAGTWFVDLAPWTTDDGVAEAVCAALGIAAEPGTTPRTRLVRRLAGEHALLLLDNCEHLADPVAVLAEELLTQAPGVALLVTSRVPLRVPGEVVVEVPPLPTPQESDDHGAGVGDATHAPTRPASVQLFLERAVVADPHFALDDETLGAIEEICRRVDGLPLAIELAASRVRVLAVTEIAARLDVQIQLLRDPGGRRAPRHRALEAALAWSTALLSPEDGAFFRALSVFAGGWDLPGAAAVTSCRDEGEALDRLVILAEHGLVVVGRAPSRAAARGRAKAEGSRYRLLEPVRQFARHELRRAGEEAAVLRRHRDAYLARAEEANAHLFGADLGPWLDRLEQDHANFLVALDTSAADPEGVVAGLRLVGTLGRFWHVRSHVEVGVREISRALERPGAERPTRERARALTVAGALAAWSGRSDGASDVLDEALRIWRDLGDRVGESQALFAAGGAALHSGDPERAWSVWEAGLAAFRDTGDERGVALVLMNLGVLAYARGTKEEAHRLFGESAELHRSVGDRASLALALGNRSAISAQLGEPEIARREIAESLRLSLELGALSGAISAMATSGTLALASGDGEAAASIFGTVGALVTASGLGLSTRQREELTRMVGEVAASLPAERFAAAEARGRSLSFEEAAHAVLAWLEP
jgi:predicted ATPase